MKTTRSLIFPIVSICYALASLALLLFSYTQVDLSLTLSRVSIFQTIQKTFQYIGFYQRPVATFWYILLVVCFFLLYGLVLYAAQIKKISLRGIWICIAIVTVLVVLSYPAFSYDIFNYMFSAKTILVYHKNPYLVTPLQFTGIEPWLSFMHWTHLPSAYTPLWLILSLPSYVFGFGYFLLILWNFKLLAAFFYIITTFFIGKILENLDAGRKNTGIALFALNPLIIFETLVSGHNDIVMMAMVMISVWCMVQKKKTLSFVFLALSVATKLMTIFLYPVFIFGYRRYLALAAMCIGLILVLFQREVLPWYLVWIMPFIALIPGNFVLTIASIGASLGLLLRYAPFLYYGHWNDPVPVLKFWGTLIPLIVSGCIVLAVYIRRQTKTKSGLVI